MAHSADCTNQGPSPTPHRVEPGIRPALSPLVKLVSAWQGLKSPKSHFTAHPVVSTGRLDLRKAMPVRPFAKSCGDSIGAVRITPTPA